MKINHVRAVALIAFAAVACTARSAGAAPMDLSAGDLLRAKIAAAAGKVPAVETVRRTVSGLDGSETIFRSGDDFREIDVDGPLHTEFGRTANQDWHQNANGQTVLGGPDPGFALADHFTTRVTAVTRPVSALVLSRLDSAGNGTKEYVDAADRVVRREVITPTETTVFAYDDFRTVDGYTAAWHWTRRDGHPENDGDYRVQSVGTRALAAGDLRIPRPRRALVEFPAAETSAELPVRLIGDRFAVHVTIAGRDYDFILDTGAAGIAIADGVAKDLGLPALRTISDTSGAARVRSSTVIVPEMRAGDLLLRDVVVQTRPDVALRAGGVNVAGTLGFDFIAELHLRLDYEHASVTAFSAAAPLPQNEVGAMAVAVRLGTQQPLTSAAVNGALGERFVIDTGNSGTLAIFDRFARLHPKALASDAPSAGGIPRYYVTGAALDADTYKLIDVDIGKLRLSNFDAFVANARQYDGGDIDGLIGAKMLRYFTVWLDYGDSDVVLVPNAYYRSATH